MAASEIGLLLAPPTSIAGVLLPVANFPISWKSRKHRPKRVDETSVYHLRADFKPPFSVLLSNTYP